MKQILVISGKGGTGKTMVTSALGVLAQNKILADCDVDAPDLHLMLNPEIEERGQFFSGHKAVIDLEKCQQCGTCREVCRFNAVSKDWRIDSLACEGCAFCYHACPHGAISLKENDSGQWFISQTRYGRFVHAKLGAGEENSGKLVALVKKKAKELGQETHSDYIVIDGPPGIGCPVIASLSGVDQAVIVVEPSLSGLHDAKRIIQLARHFEVPAQMVINKFDLNPDVTLELEKFCSQEGICVLGKIPFDEAILKAMVNGQTVFDTNDGRVKEIFKAIWEQIQSL